MNEILNYRDNIIKLKQALQGNVVERIICNEDLSQKNFISFIPFKFKYCYDIVIVTQKECYHLTTAQTSFGYETLWSQKIDLLKPGTSEISINDTVTNLITEVSNTNLPHKMILQFSNVKLTFFAADIYQNLDGYNIVFNDEMILVFDSEEEVLLLEQSKRNV